MRFEPTAVTRTYRVQARSSGGRWCWTLKIQGPGEIKRRKVVLDIQVTGSRVQARSREGREVVLDPQVSPEEIMSREVELDCESWTLCASSFTQQRCNGLCPCDSALAQQLKQQLRSTLVAAQWRGDTALTLPFFWRLSTASSVFRAGAHGRAFTLSTPPPRPPTTPPLSPSLISTLASVDVTEAKC